MDSARKFVDKGQIDKAVKEYLRIVHEDPKDVRVWLKIGDLYAKKGSKQEAIETYLKVARFYHEQGFFLKAVAVYKQILKLDPRLVDVILKLAELYRQLGLMSDAMQHFESVAAHFHREGNTKEALATVKKLVDLDPENIATRIKLAELYSKEGLVDDASQEFHVACDQLRRQNRQDDFIKVAERLLWHKPENHGLNRELAGLYLRRNDPRRALQKLQACFKADPRDVETLGLLAQAFQALDQKAKTVSVLKELARVHTENKQRDKAADVFRKILEFVPADADALAYLGPAATPPAPKPPPMPPQLRQSTPMPAQVRAADARFGITSDLPAIAPHRATMTGSMPLVDEQSLSGVDFALPEYDDADFSADMEPGPDPRATSAAGERHEGEISKILAETDVYVKYGLHQKAVDHLRRIFNLDPENVEAHERLKDIFISQGREQEAEQELLKLAELVASGDPDRAETYLQELLQINGTHTGAFELARRFRLRVARLSSHAEQGYAGGGVATVDPDLDDLDLARPDYRRGAVGVARHPSLDDFDADDLLGRVAHGSPTPQPPPAPPYGHAAATDAFDLELDPQAQDTRQINAGQLDHLAAPDDDDDDSLIVDAPRRWQDDGHGNAPTRFEPQLGRALDAQLDDDAIGGEIDQDVAAELGHPSDLPFDPDEARAFDAGVRGNGYANQFADAAGPQRTVADANAFDYDPYDGTTSQPYDPTAAHAVGAYGGAVDLDDIDDNSMMPQPAVPARAETTVEDDLDEADFYVGQGMYQEALDVLHTLLARYPNHRLIQTKIREVDALVSGGELDAADSIEQEVPNDTGALDLDEIEELPLEELEELPPVPAKVKQRGPAVMLQRPVDESDADTHYDLGLAYREMGLQEEAIKAFEKALRAPGREVQCRQMIGMCHRDLGNSSESILQFKQGLHDEPSERERQSLYYEIGVTYEMIGDYAESLYYYEMVTKRDPGFADAAQRAQSLRERGAAPHDDDI